MKFPDWIKSAGIATNKDLEKIKSEINEVVEKAVDFAESSDEPDISELDKDIYKK